MVNFQGAKQPPNTVIFQYLATTAGQSHTLLFDAGGVSYNISLQTLHVTLTGATILLSRTLNFRDQSATSSAIDLILDRVRITNPSANAIFVTLSASLSLTGSPGFFPIRMEASEFGDVLECSIDLSRWTIVADRRVPEPGPLPFFDTESFAPGPAPRRLFCRIGRK